MSVGAVSFCLSLCAVYYFAISVGLSKVRKGGFTVYVLNRIISMHAVFHCNKDVNGLSLFLRIGVKRMKHFFQYSFKITHCGVSLYMGRSQRANDNVFQL